MAKIITRVTRPRTYPSARNANSGRIAKRRKIAISNALPPTSPRAPARGEEPGAATSAMSAPLRGEQAGRPDVEHDGHQQIDQHRGDRRPDRARGRRREE